MIRRLFIIAQHRPEAEHVAWTRGLSHTEWEYLHHPSQVLGMRDIEVWVTDTARPSVELMAAVQVVTLTSRPRP